MRRSRPAPKTKASPKKRAPKKAPKSFVVEGSDESSAGDESGEKNVNSDEDSDDSERSGKKKKKKSNFHLVERRKDETELLFLKGVLKVSRGIAIHVDKGEDLEYILEDGDLKKECANLRLRPATPEETGLHKNFKLGLPEESNSADEKEEYEIIVLHAFEGVLNEVQVTNIRRALAEKGVANISCTAPLREAKSQKMEYVPVPDYAGVPQSVQDKCFERLIDLGHLTRNYVVSKTTKISTLPDIAFLDPATRLFPLLDAAGKIDLGALLRSHRNLLKLYERRLKKKYSLEGGQQVGQDAETQNAEMGSQMELNPQNDTHFDLEWLQTTAWYVAHAMKSRLIDGSNIVQGKLTEDQLKKYHLINYTYSQI